MLFSFCFAHRILKYMSKKQHAGNAFGVDKVVKRCVSLRNQVGLLLITVAAQADLDLLGEEEGDVEMRCLTCHRTGWVMPSSKYRYLYLELLIASLTLLARLANKATNQILISVLDFVFLFASCHLTWTCTKKSLPGQLRRRHAYPDDFT